EVSPFFVGKEQSRCASRGKFQTFWQSANSGALNGERRALNGAMYTLCRFSRLLRQKPAFSALICLLLRQLFAGYCAKADLWCRLLRQTCKANHRISDQLPFLEPTCRTFPCRAEQFWRNPFDRIHEGTRDSLHFMIEGAACRVFRWSGGILWVFATAS